MKTNSQEKEIKRVESVAILRSGGKQVPDRMMIRNNGQSVAKQRQT
jgi:hypothetical protein